MTTDADQAWSLLAETKALLEKGWCRGRSAINQAGRAVPLRSPKAVKWCLGGALWRAVLDSGVPEDANPSTVAPWKIAIESLEQATGSNLGIPTWQDRPERTLPEVLEVVDRAMASLTP